MYQMTKSEQTSLKSFNRSRGITGSSIGTQNVHLLIGIGRRSAGYKKEPKVYLKCFENRRVRRLPSCDFGPNSVWAFGCLGAAWVLRQSNSCSRTLPASAGPAPSWLRGEHQNKC